METTQLAKGNKLIVCFNDKDKQKAPLTYEDPPEEELHRLNQLGYGIFETANAFSATDEEVKASEGITKRQKEFLAKLLEVFADVDVCKEEYGLPEEKRENLKNALKEALMKTSCPPTVIVITKNGLQPRWTVDESGIDELTQQKYVNIINGIIEWSKQNGALGDPVKDVTRVLRKPGFLHVKSDPYLITEEPGSGRTYTLDELKACFWQEREKKKPELTSPTQQQPSSPAQTQSVFSWVDELDIRQVAIDVWKEKGHDVYANDNNQLVCNGGNCGCVPGKSWAAFINREGKNFISNGGSSEYPAEGNAITYVAGTLEISNSEAYKWLAAKYPSTSAVLGTDPTYFKEEYAKNSAQGGYKLAKYLADAHHVITFGEKKREIFVYEDGIYIPGESFLRGEIQRLLEESASKNVKNEIIEKIMDLTRAKRDISVANPGLINLQNGVFDITSGKLLPHDPKYRFFSKIPVDYNPDALCPKIDKFFKDILQEEDIPVMEEFFGFVLFRSYFIKKAMILVGDKDTGKTTVLLLLDKFIGRSNISGVSLQRLATDKFSGAAAYNKHINIYDDLSAKDIRDNGMFKIATGGGIITGELKFRDSFQFINYAKLIFACNHIPGVKETDDDAYFNRWIVIEFNNKILNLDKFLLNKITTPEELSGLLNTALRGLKRLLGRQEFSYNLDSDEIKVQMLRSGSSIAKFAYDCLIQADPGSWISKEDMYQYYAEYARGAGLPVESMKKFGGRLPQFATYIHDGRPKVPGQEKGQNKRDTAWMGVEIANTGNGAEVPPGEPP